MILGDSLNQGQPDSCSQKVAFAGLFNLEYLKYSFYSFSKQTAKSCSSVFPLGKNWDSSCAPCSAQHWHEKKTTESLVITVVTGMLYNSPGGVTQQLLSCSAQLWFQHGARADNNGRYKKSISVRASPISLSGCICWQLKPVALWHWKCNPPLAIIQVSAVYMWQPRPELFCNSSHTTSA